MIKGSFRAKGSEAAKNPKTGKLLPCGLVTL